MKKLLLLASILAMSGVAMAAATDGTGKADLNVKARIVKPLSIETKALDFGIIAAGSDYVRVYGENDPGAGRIKIDGTPSSKITLGFEDEKNPGSKFGDVVLYNENNNPNDKLVASLIITNTGNPAASSWDERNNADTSLVLGKDGKHELYVGGKILNVSPDQAAGLYSGNMTVTATYEPFEN